jgi:hypothetical protein
MGIRASLHAVETGCQSQSSRCGDWVSEPVFTLWRLGIRASLHAVEKRKILHAENRIRVSQSVAHRYTD